MDLFSQVIGARCDLETCQVLDQEYIQLIT
jgi:hypothetical protein